MKETEWLKCTHQIVFIFSEYPEQDLAPVFQFREGTLSWLPEGHRASLSPLLYKNIKLSLENFCKDMENLNTDRRGLFFPADKPGRVVSKRTCLVEPKLLLILVAKGIEVLFCPYWRSVCFFIFIGGNLANAINPGLLEVEQNIHC